VGEGVKGWMVRAYEFLLKYGIQPVRFRKVNPAVVMGWFHLILTGYMSFAG
jgi:hypothetical protein